MRARMRAKKYLALAALATLAIGLLQARMPSPAKAPLPASAPASSAAFTGYRLVTGQGVVYSHGSAPYFGDTASLTLNKPVVGMAATPDGKGYWLVAADGGIFTFGDATFYGSQGGTALGAPVVAMNPNLDVALPPMGQPGVDASNYQCGLPASPTPASFIVIQATGWPFTAVNPCMAQEAAWASNNYQLYVFMGLPVVTNSSGQLAWNSGVASSDYSTGPQSTTTLAGQAYNYGYNSALYALAQATAQGVSAPIWWLDIEGSSMTQYFSPSGALNTAAIQGAVDAFAQKGIVAGLYSGRAWMYSLITTGVTTGPGATIVGPAGGPIPLWFYSSTGTTACTATTSSSGVPYTFAGGIPWYIQTGVYNNQIDTDVSC